jgi:branched-chain amino acid transport system substrate-binding protein
MKLRPVFLGVASFAIAFAQTASAQSFKIGLNVERTGNAASYGGHVIIASQIAVEHINANGGVDGTPIELVIQDNRTSPEQAVVAVRNLGGTDAVAVLGPIQTSQARTAFPATNRAEIVSISPGSGAPGLAAQNRPWAFRNAAMDDRIFSDVVQAFKKNNPDAQKVALVMDPKDAYQVAFIGKVAPPALEKHGLTIVNKGNPLEIPTEANDHSVFVTKLRSMGVDAAVLGLVIEQGQTFLHELNRQKVAMPMLTGIGYVTNSVAEIAGKRNVYSGQPFDPNADSETVKSFVTEFEARSKKELPGQYTVPLYIDAGAYESIRIVADALKATGAKPGDDIKEIRTKVRDYMSKLKDYQGLGNTLTIDEHGDAVKPTQVFETIDGAWKKM